MAAISDLLTIASIRIGGVVSLPAPCWAARNLGFTRFTVVFDDEPRPLAEWPRTDRSPG
jgi:hypothetical protein